MWPRAHLRFITLGLCAALLTACAALPPDRRDGPPGRPLDVSRIPDAVPRLEPLAASGNMASYTINGRRYQTRPSSRGYVARGVASWYGVKFHGRKTSSGEPYDMYAMTAAHRSLPLPTYVQVTNLDNGRRVIVKVNDRGPFHDHRLIDLSYAAAVKLGFAERGTARVEVRAIDPRRWPPKPSDTRRAAPGDAPLYVQVGAYRQRGNAERISRQLRDLGHGVYILPTTGDKPGQALYRVRMGPFHDMREASRLSADLRRRGIKTPRIVAD